MIKLKADIVTTMNDNQHIELEVGDNLYTQEMQLNYIRHKYNTPIIRNLVAIWEK